MTTTFTVEMQELRKHINFVKNGLGNSRTDLPVMMLRFTIHGEKVIIFAANKEMFCRTEMKVTRPNEEEGDGTFGVLGGKIERLISQVESEKVNFQSDGGENLEIKAGFLTVQFELYDSSALKTIDEGVKEHLTTEGMGIDRLALEEAMSCGKSCTSSSSTKPDLNHVEMRKGKVLSSDGRKIMIYHHDGFPKEVEFKVPSTCINDFISALKNMPDTQTVQIIEGKSYYYIKGHGNKFTLGIRKVERKFPAIENQVAETSQKEDEISIDKTVLENMLKGVSLGLPYDDVRVQLELTGMGQESVLEVSALNSAGKRSHERASCGRKKEEPICFPLSFKHLLDTLGVFKGDSVVDMIVVSKKNLLMVRDVTEARQVLTVIPFRTDKQIAEERKEKEVVAETKKPKLPTTQVGVEEEIDLAQQALE